MKIFTEVQYYLNHLRLVDPNKLQNNTMTTVKKCLTFIAPMLLIAFELNFFLFGAENFNETTICFHFLLTGILNMLNVSIFILKVLTIFETFYRFEENINRR